jgi:hypothetical protein
MCTLSIEIDIEDAIISNRRRADARKLVLDEVGQAEGAYSARHAVLQDALWPAMQITCCPAQAADGVHHKTACQVAGSLPAASLPKTGIPPY